MYRYTNLKEHLMAAKHNKGYTYSSFATDSWKYTNQQ